VVQECKEEDWKRLGYAKGRSDWYGDGLESNLGVGVFCKEGITITRLPEWGNDLSKNTDFRYLIPYRVAEKEQVEGKMLPFTLIAVWTKNKMDMSDPLDYVQKAHAAIDHYANIGLLKGRVILIGDFNSNTIWDKLYREDRNHSALVEKLAKLGIKNCSKPDEENKYSTYYYYPRGQEKYVIDDYCFASASIADSAKLSVSGIDEWIPNAGGKKLWCGLSDHCPIIVDFDF
jgi:exonuclease III